MVDVEYCFDKMKVVLFFNGVCVNCSVEVDEFVVVGRSFGEFVFID